VEPAPRKGRLVKILHAKKPTAVTRTGQKSYLRWRRKKKGGGGDPHRHQPCERAPSNSTRGGKEKGEKKIDFPDLRRVGGEEKGVHVKEARGKKGLPNATRKVDISGIQGVPPFLVERKDRNLSGGRKEKKKKSDGRFRVVGKKIEERGTLIYLRTEKRKGWLFSLCFLKGKRNFCPAADPGKTQSLHFRKKSPPLRATQGGVAFFGGGVGVAIRDASLVVLRARHV